MFKLIAVGGKLRGKEFELKEGDNIIGRSPDSDISVQIDGVSKKHVSITVNKDTCFVEDQGSSNGTFINGKLVKKATIKHLDKITLPNVIFQLVYVKEKKVVIKKKVAKESNEDFDSFLKETPPSDLPGKLKFLFRNKIMTILYSFNEKYEWNVMLGIILFLFVCTNIGLTISPVLMSSKNLLIGEIKNRGIQYVNEVSRANAIFLARGEIEKINTNFLDDSLKTEGVEGYELFDMQGRIIRPVSKIDRYIDEPFAIAAKAYFSTEKNYQKEMVRALGNNTIGIAKPLLVNNIQTGGQEAVGIISIHFKPQSLQDLASNHSTAYLEALVITCVAAIFFYGFIYYLTIRSLQEFKFEIDEVMRGKKKEVEGVLLFEEMNSIKNTVNSNLQRLRELQSDTSDEFVDIEDDVSYVAILKEFMEGADGPIMILNSEKNIEHMNERAEDLLGIRESSAQGESLLDTARNEGVAATIIDLCDQSANNTGTHQSEIYELQGKDYSINVTSLMGKDNFAKAFYISFVVE